jgi:hypothetical protein
MEEGGKEEDGEDKAKSKLDLLSYVAHFKTLLKSLAVQKCPVVSFTHRPEKK